MTPPCTQSFQGVNLMLHVSNPHLQIILEIIISKTLKTSVQTLLALVDTLQILAPSTEVVHIPLIYLHSYSNQQINY